MIFLWLACTIPSTDTAPPVPSIQSAAIACLPVESEWTATVELDAWSDGTTLFLTDGEFLEEHSLKLISASPDAAGEFWSLTLGIAGDPDDARNGSSSRFLCSDEVFYRFVVDLDGYAADCEGPAFAWPESVPTCPEAITE